MRSHSTRSWLVPLLLTFVALPGCDSGPRACDPTPCPPTYCAADQPCGSWGMCECPGGSYCDEYDTHRCQPMIEVGAPCEIDRSCTTELCSRLDPRVCIEPGELDAPCARHDECASNNCSLIQDYADDPQVAGRCIPPAGSTCDPAGDECTICLPVPSGGECAQLCESQWGAFCAPGEICLGRLDWPDTYWCNRVCTDLLDGSPRPAPSACPEGFRCYDRYEGERDDETFYAEDRYVCWPDAFFM